MVFQKISGNKRRTTNKELFFSKDKEQYLSIENFKNMTNYSGYNPSSNLIIKLKDKYNTEDSNFIKLIAYIQNLNKSHKYFYSGFILSLGLDINKDFEVLNYETNDNKIIEYNAVLVEYDKKRDKPQKLGLSGGENEN